MKTAHYYFFLIPLILSGCINNTISKIPDKLVVLTFDDSVASHARFVAPYLKDMGFGATFFITEGFDFKKDKLHYMNWQEIKQLDRDGFEIGNHTKAHIPVTKQSDAMLKQAIDYIDEQCKNHQIIKPISFCYPNYKTTETAVKQLLDLGFKYARAGGNRAFDPEVDNPLLIPQAFDGKPDSTLQDFIRSAKLAQGNKIAVMTFHGVPDIKHPWVSTDVEKFKSYMNYLKENHFTVISMRELSKYIKQENRL